MKTNWMDWIEPRAQPEFNTRQSEKSAPDGTDFASCLNQECQSNTTERVSNQKELSARERVKSKKVAEANFDQCPIEKNLHLEISDAHSTAKPLDRTRDGQSPEIADFSGIVVSQRTPVQVQPEQRNWIAPKSNFIEGEVNLQSSIGILQQEPNQLIQGQTPADVIGTLGQASDPIQQSVNGPEFDLGYQVRTLRSALATESALRPDREAPDQLTPIPQDFAAMDDQGDGFRHPNSDGFAETNDGSEPTLVDSGVHTDVFQLLEQGTDLGSPGLEPLERNEIGNLDKPELNAFDLTNWQETETSKLVIRQLMDPISRLVVSDLQSRDRQLSIQINPAELGQLEIRVTDSREGMLAQIFATEAFTSELLNREKLQLVEALNEQGIMFPSLEISHRGSDRQSAGSPYKSPEDCSRTVPSHKSGLKTTNRFIHSNSLIDVLV